MRQISLFFLLVVSLSVSQAQVATPVPSLFTDSSWESHEIGQGMTWKSALFDNLFQSAQSINWLSIDPEQADIEFGIAYLDAGRATTSQLAKNYNAIGAINGTFFNMANGGSVCFLKVNDTLINRSQSDLRTYLDESAIGIHDDGSLHILTQPSEGWGSLVDFTSLMATGPLLVYEGDTLGIQKDKFNQNRHPRSGIGITKEGHVLFITADGRNKRAEGLSIPEFAEVMLSLGCEYAINLDGGGSTTLYIHNQNENGIVSYPSDNKQFDHKGERKVANILYVRKRNKFQ